MPEASRQRYVEYHSPRTLILTLCFLWGIGVGFALNFIVPKSGDAEPAAIPAAVAVPRTGPETPSEIERRRQDTPNIAEVAPAPAAAANTRPTIADIAIGPPAAVLTTEGGLTGKTAATPGTAAAPVRIAAPVRQPTTPSAPPPPPPLPDLMP